MTTETADNFVRLKISKCKYLWHIKLFKKKEVWTTFKALQRKFNIIYHLVLPFRIQCKLVKKKMENLRYWTTLRWITWLLLHSTCSCSTKRVFLISFVNIKATTVDNINGDRCFTITVSGCRKTQLSLNNHYNIKM